MKSILCNVIGGLGLVLSMWGCALDELGMWLDKKAFEIWSR